MILGRIPWSRKKEAVVSLASRPSTAPGPHFQKDDEEMKEYRASNSAKAMQGIEKLAVKKVGPLLLFLPNSADVFTQLSLPLGCQTQDRWLGKILLNEYLWWNTLEFGLIGEARAIGNGDSRRRETQSGVGATLRWLNIYFMYNRDDLVFMKYFPS